MTALVLRSSFLGRLPVAAPAARSLAGWLRSAGLTPVGVRLDERPVAVVEPAPPEVRARASSGMGRLGVRIFNPTEYALWAAEHGGGRPHWGELPDIVGARDARALLRRASGLLWHELPSALSRCGRHGDGLDSATSLTLRLRGLLEQVVPPSGFPPLPGEGARARELQRTALGAAHVAFAGSDLEEPGPSLAADALPEAPARTADALRSAMAPLLADLGGPVRDALHSLLLVPGPVGTRHAWTVVALVDDALPLHRAAAVRDALDGHMAMARIPCLLRPSAPVVLTTSTFRSMLGGRLFRRPLRRLAVRLHAVVLSGDAPEAPRGLDASDADRRTELAALLEATAAAWRPDARGVDVEDLLFGAWPAAIHHVGYGDPHASQASILEAFARRTDPAVSRVGSKVHLRAWGDPEAADRGRPTALLRDWGPALVRVQEVAMETLR